MMTQSRISLKEDFPNLLKVSPHILEINGQSEWVDNLVKFGDLIEEQMGQDSRDFYFEQLYDMLEELTLHERDFDCDCEDDEEEPKESTVVQVTVPKKTKSSKQCKPIGKRLF